MFEFLSNDFETSIRFAFVCKEEVKNTEKKLAKRYKSALRIKGTRLYHMFAPVDLSSMRVSELSRDEGTIVQVAK